MSLCTIVCLFFYSILYCTYVKHFTFYFQFLLWKITIEHKLFIAYLYNIQLYVKYFLHACEHYTTFDGHKNPNYFSQIKTERFLHHLELLERNVKQFGSLLKLIKMKLWWIKRFTPLWVSFWGRWNRWAHLHGTSTLTFNIVM